MRTPLALTLALLASTACRDNAAFFPDAGELLDALGAPDASADAGASSIDDAGASPTADAGRGSDAASTAPDAAGPAPDAAGAAPDDAGPAPDAAVVDPRVPGPGDLVFVEAQGNPQNTADDTAEYFELVNVSGRELDLMGCRLAHRVWQGSGMAPEMSVGVHTFGASVRVAVGARVLLTRSTGGYFGGAMRSATYGGFELGNGATDNNRVRLLGPSWDGRDPPASGDVIDEIVAPQGTFDNDLRGRAWQLDPARVANPDAASNDDPAAWCHAAADAALAYWMSNWGTPGAANVCP